MEIKRRKEEYPNAYSSYVLPLGQADVVKRSTDPKKSEFVNPGYKQQERDLKMVLGVLVP
ncbi:hypothetical protein Q9966_010696 [Columba livia]|nr:hypothetical protein Q9966_010696 [Columba livia]